APGVPAPEPRPYSQWFSGTDADVLDNKSKFLLNSLGKGLPVQPYFSSFKEWLWKIFKGLRLGYTLRPLAFSNLPESETDSQAWSLDDDDDEDSKFNYEWTTLNKRVSYAKIRLIMSSFEGQPLETRWVGNPDY
ncbi:hypothetical protein F5876DRAFT_84153, partial [Lentinula aff. lateritia]